MSSGLAMSVDEIVAYLSRSALPTLIVEGSGDKAILRRVQTELQTTDVDIFYVGGKGKLDSIFNRRAEYSGLAVAFLRDKDDWVIFGIPPGNDDIVLTNGYSLENDILDKAVIDKLASPNEAKLHAAIDAVALWFVHAIRAVSQGGDIDISRDVTAIWNGGNYVAPCSDEIDRYPCDLDFLNKFGGDKWAWLRGKTLLRIVQHHLSAGSPSYSKDQIVDLCIRWGPSKEFADLLARIKARFPAAQGSLL